MLLVCSFCIFFKLVITFVRLNIFVGRELGVIIVCRFCKDDVATWNFDIFIFYDMKWNELGWVNFWMSPTKTKWQIDYEKNCFRYLDEYLKIWEFLRCDNKFLYFIEFFNWIIRIINFIIIIVSDSLIGVHCSHGLNRTGYLVCRYMIQKMGTHPQEAISRKYLLLNGAFIWRITWKLSSTI